MASEPLTVQVIYPFKGKNNDELCLKKGDIITVTQKDEGWWEGTLNGKTGWFPSNFVKEFTAEGSRLGTIQQKQYKMIVFKDLVDSERAHVTELEGLVTDFLQPLETEGILSADEYLQLTGNINEVLETHQELLRLIEAEEKKPGQEQRLGRLFLSWAPKIKMVHQAYCSLHPKAVLILDKYRDELMKYMEGRGAATPGILVLTTLLSKPFRRLGKYSGMMQELERHIEENHQDRGDTQRSLSVYKEIYALCMATRRQKELELQILTGPIKGWEGPSLSTFGEVLQLSLVTIGSQHQDRYLVLFSSTLVILSISPCLSAFVYEGKLPLSGIFVRRLEDNDQHKNAFDISAPMIEKMTVICHSEKEADCWVESLQNMSSSSSSGNINQKVVPSQAEFVPQPPPHMSLQMAASNQSEQSACNKMSLAAEKYQKSQSLHWSSHYVNSENTRSWSALSFRPTQSLCPWLTLGPFPNGVYNRSHAVKHVSYKEDGFILDVIEAYCTLNNKSKCIINSADFAIGNEKKVQSENQMPSIVSHLESKIQFLQNNLAVVQSQLYDEVVARCSLQNILKTYMVENCKEYAANIDWPTIENAV